MIAVSLISVVDDDPSVRESLPRLLTEFGYTVRTFEGADAFLISDALEETRCLILDVTMPGMSGPQLQQELTRRGLRIPIIFITAQSSETMRASLFAKGAVDVLPKPFGDAALLDAINRAIPESFTIRP
jgi:FixJ family two-component response regulator